MNKNLKKKFNRKKLKRLIEKSYEPKIQNLNPFDIQHNKRKSFTKVANNSSGVKRAEQKRKDTLLVEYKKRNVRNKTIDLRIGDNTINNNLNSQKLIKEKQRQSKRNIFNLNDNEELTHMGTRLSQIESFEKLNEQIEDKEINADLVSKLHFGGFESNAENEKGIKTYLQELISINKKDKYEKQKEKENLDEFRERLDQTWKELRMMVSSSYNKKDEVNVIDKSNIKNDSNIKDQNPSIPLIETNKQNGSFELESYDAIFKSLQYENKVTDNSVSAVNQTLVSQTLNESKTLKKSDHAITKEKDFAKIKKYVSTYSADALFFDECVDYGSNSKEKNVTSGQLRPKFELVYDENGQIASSLLQNLSNPDGEEMNGNSFKEGDRLLSRASGIMKDVKINLFLKSTHTPPASNEISGKEYEMALPFFSYQSFCEKLQENSVNSYACLLPLLDDPTIYKSSEAILLPEKKLTEGDKNLFTTLHLLSNTITYTLRYLVELSLKHDSRPGDYRDMCETICSLLFACKFFASRPNLIYLVMEKMVTSPLSRYVFAYTTKTYLAHSKRGDNSAENMDHLNYPGRKLFTFTTCLATLLRHLPSTDFAKLRQRVIYLLNTNLSHLSHILALKSALPASISNDMVRKGCYSVTSLVELSSLTQSNAVYYPEPFAFFITALEKMTSAIQDPSDTQISEELSLLLDTLLMFLRICFSPSQFKTGDAKLNIEWSPLLAAFPELLKDLNSKLKPLSDLPIDCEASRKVLRLIDEATVQIKGQRASHNFDAKPTHKNDNGKTLKYPKLLEPLLEAPKHSAAWRREQRSKHLKNKKVGVSGDNDGYYLATPESLAERKRLKHMHKRDLKTTKKELRKDALFLARHQLQEQMEKDKSRKEKVKRLYAILADQEGECRAIKKTKIRANF